ncbi:sphingosine kinase 2-like isoform X2 [Physella acuta]|uniref:sphingosine kinase 2-like isoform X2 n=1 Tax=Physella acuta TaxID=109671 RepID=UPI0027DCC79E|nr:sphingosine kinase 2-like isoform X2 [Physella acuta]
MMNVLTQDIPNSVPPPRGKLLFLINPHSGPGKAHIIFKTEIVPMLFEADIPYKAFITDHAGHASELIKEINLSEWYGVVIVSGDGLIYETINGIMQRDDWASAIKIPVGCLPGGSGNALCCAINYAAGEPLDASMVLHSTFVLTKHKVIPMDLVAVHIPNQTIFSFLSVTWGIMADIDYESEKYRKLGEARFTIGAINRIFSLRTYRGRVSFLPVAEYNPKETGNSKKVLTKIRRFSLRSRSNSKSTNDSTESVAKQRCYSMDHSAYGERQMYLGDAKLDRGDHKEISGSSVDESMVTEDVFDKTSLNKEEMDIGADMSEQGNNVTNYNNKNDTESTNSDADQLNKDKIVSMVESLNGALEPKGDKNINQQTTQQKEKTENATTLNSSSVESGHMTILSEKQEIVVEEERYHCKKSDYAPFPTPLLPPLDQDVPDNWVKFEGDFILAAAVYQTHLGSDMLAAPDAHLQDGVIHLMMVREGISKAGLLKLFLSFGQGGHVHSPYVESAKVLAFRIEPSTTSGNIMIDGERFDPSPIQGQILPGLARVMAIQ